MKNPEWFRTLSITDLSVAIDYMHAANEQAMRDKVRKSSFTESQKPLKMRYPYSNKVIDAVGRELKARIEDIKESINRQK